MSTNPVPRRGRHRVWTFLLGGMAAMLLLLGVGIYNLLTLTHEAAVLRRELLAGDGFRITRRLEGTVGPVLLAGAELVLRFIPQAPAEAREALAAVTSVSIGVYELERHTLPTAREQAVGFAAADAAMQRRGWTCVASLNKRGQRLQIYTPATETAGRELRVCIAACDNRRLVVVSVRADARDLEDFVQRRIPKLIPSLADGGRRMDFPAGRLCLGQ